MTSAAGREPGFPCDKCDGSVLIDLDDESKDETFDLLEELCDLLRDGRR